MHEDEYRHLGEEFLSRARQIKNPELKAVYLRLALVYDELARFHEKMEPLSKIDDKLQK